MNSHNERSIFEEDFNYHFFNNLNTLDLISLSNTSKKMKEVVGTYIYDMLEPYGYSHYEFSPYCKTSHNYDEKIIIPNLEYARKALALAVTFNPSNIEMILKLHPEIISCVIETRTVTITDPITKQSFTALWHFKLSHLLAAVGNTNGIRFLNFIFRKKDKANYQTLQDQYFSEPICWETKDKKGSKGPTAPFIAILYHNNRFFRDIAGDKCELTLKDGFDEPYNQINPCHIALQQHLSYKEDDCFYTLINLYAYTNSASMIQDCINIIFSQALKGNYVFLEILLGSPSNRIEHFLTSGLFMALEENNMDVIKLISRKYDNMFHARNDEYKSPLTIATHKTLKDPQYLPMVKHFLCCGCQPEKGEKKLLEENLTDSLSTLFDKNDSIKKQIRHYFKTAKCFYDFVHICAKNNSLHYLSFYTQKMEKNPEKALLATAKLDKAFFNELVVSFLESENEWMLNKTLNHFDDKKRFYKYLLGFADKHQNAFYLTADTLEKIGDSLIRYRKSRAFTRCENDIDALKMAAQFYQFAIAGSENYERVLQKLHGIGEHKELTLEYFCKK